MTDPDKQRMEHDHRQKQWNQADFTERIIRIFQAYKHASQSGDEALLATVERQGDIVLPEIDNLMNAAITEVLHAAEKQAALFPASPATDDSMVQMDETAYAIYGKWYDQIDSESQTIIDKVIQYVQTERRAASIAEGAKNG